MTRLYRLAYILFLFQVTGAQAQELAQSRTSSYYTFIYQLTNKQAGELYSAIWNLEKDHLNKLHDFFPTDSTYKKELPTGHYLFVKSNGRNFSGELKSVNNIDLKLLNNHRDLMMVFHDSNGSEVSEAEVSIRKRKVPFDRKTKSYRIKKANKRGMISAEYSGHTSYFEIDRQFNNGLLVRTGRRIIHNFPVREIVSPVVYLKNNVQNIIRGGGPYLPPIFYKITRPFRPKEYTGYIAFNKPMYKPGDTVKLKAFITTHKGKPYRKTAVINLKQFRPRFSNKKLQALEPFRDGAFRFEFKLTDTLKLQLDNNYSIEFTTKRNRALISNTFRYEDYELKNNVYSLRADDADQGKPAALYLKGTDSNDMPLFDVRAEILIRPSQVHQFYRRNIFVADTLWFHQTKLESIGETKVIIPDSIMPDASLDYEAIVSFLNSDNERVVKNSKLQFDRNSVPVAISLQNDSLVVTSSDTKQTLTNVLLQALQGDKHVTKSITLPYKEKLNNFIDTYWVTRDGKTKSLTVGEEDDELEVLASRTKDSLFISADNPRKISFRYFLFRNRSLIEEGEGTHVNITKNSKPNDSYSLSVQYVWAGESQTEEFNIPFDTKNLDVKIEHAAVVYPGESAPFTISVKDAFGKPAENVDLTAYAITKKFSSQQIPTVPNLARPKRTRAAFNEFHLKESETYIRKTLEYSYWRKILGLDSITFYKFMFPDSGYFEDRSKATVPQFAPFVVGYDVETVHVIYVDGQPVYYKDVDTVEPYSFAIKPGLHQVQLRLRNALLTVNNVKIDSAQKLMFSVNRYKLPKHCSLVEMPYKFTDEELKKLSRYFVQIKWPAQQPNAYIAQGDRLHVYSSSPRNYYGSAFLTGPFYPGKATYFEKDGLHVTFDYEPFNTYEFRKGFLKLKQLNIQNILKAERFGWYSSDIPPFTDEVLTKKKVEKYWAENQSLRVNSFRRFPAFAPVSNRVGKLTLDYFGGRNDQLFTKATFILNLDNPDEYYVLPHLSKNEMFNEGRYQAVVILHDNRYVKVDSIEVKPYGTSYYNLLPRYTPQVPDSFSTHVLQLIEKWSEPETYLLHERAMELQSLRTLYYQESSAINSYTHTVTGRITSSDEEGIPGVNVVLKGTAVGTATDAEGYYTLKCPPNGELVFSFIGYQTVEQPIDHRSTVNTRMNEDVTHLSEVVVVGYGVQHSRQNLSASVALAGRAPGIAINASKPNAKDSVSIHIRGLTSIDGSQEPLVILDGRIVRFSDVDKNLITTIDVIKGSEAVALYGSNAAGGVILMSTKPGATRSYLREMSKAVIQTAALETTPGNSLRKNFHDYAFWQPSLKTDENGKATFNATFPDDITGWNTYVLGMGTKRRTGQTSSTIQSYKPLLAQIAQPHFLIDGDHAKVPGKITNYGQEKIQLTRSIKVNETLLHDERIELTTSWIDTIALETVGTDSVSIEYVVNFDKYKDGELRKIPVLRKGTLEAQGKFLSLATDTTFTLDFSSGNDVVKLYAQADLVDVLIDEINYLKHYVYECNEQLASKLKGLLVEKAVSQHRKSNFYGDDQIQKIAKRLISHQNEDGSWSWWKGGYGEVWITLHVTRTLLRAQKEGYHINFDQEQLINYLESQLATLPTSSKLDVLNFLAEQGQMLRVKDLADSVKRSENFTVLEKLKAERLLQSMGHPVDWKWVNSFRSTTIKGNYYWGEDILDVSDNSILNTLIVYQMAIKDSNKDIVKIENYFLEQRKTHWRNTYESSLILESLLPEIMKRSKPGDAPKLQLAGTVTKTIDTFPSELSATPGKLTVTKSGNAPVYFTAYTETWNTAPDAKNKTFAIQTVFEDSSNKLTAGKPVMLKVEVEIKNDAEYVMIEVPIPAGCSYRSKEQYRMNGEVHREYYNHKTNIYCKFLKKGKYTYNVELLPRYSGTYTLNPAVVECMYFPTLYGREEVKRVVIR